MPLTISGKNMDVGTALRQRIEERIMEAAGKYFDGQSSGTVTMTKSGAGFDADCTLHLDSGVLLKTGASALDPNVAFEQAADKIDKRLRRYKRRLKAHRGTTNQDAADVEVAMANYAILATPDEDDELEANYAPLVVAETPTKIRTMTVGMAVLELDLIDAPALLFKNAASGTFNVVYRRPDGNVGWIDPSLVDAPQMANGSAVAAGR
jgi:ribosomal subunit interface protein